MIAELNNAVMSAFGSAMELISQGVTYPINGVFSNATETDGISNVPFATAGFRVDVLTSELSGVSVKPGDTLTVEDVLYEIVEPPFDDMGITLLMLRKR